MIGALFTAIMLDTKPKQMEKNEMMNKNTQINTYIVD